MIARIAAFVPALVVMASLVACAQSPRGTVTSTVPPADKPLAVDPALIAPKPAATGYQLGRRDAEQAPEGSF